MATKYFKVQSRDINDVESQLNNFMAAGDYRNAANLAHSARLADPIKQARFMASYNEARMKARREDAIANNINDPYAKAAYQFVKMQHTNGIGFKKGENQIYDMWQNNVNNLGGRPEDENGATSINIRFAPKTLKRKGIFGIDWLRADVNHNEDGFSTFSRQIELNADGLKKLGVRVVKDKYGYTSIQVDKNNTKALYKVFNALARTNTRYDGRKEADPNDDSKGIPMFQITGINRFGKEVDVSGGKNSDANDYVDSDAQDAITSKQLNSIFGLQKEAADYYNNIVNIENKNPIVAQVMYANGVSQQDLINYANGEKSSIKKDQIERDYNSLKQTDLSQFKVFSNIDGNGNLFDKDLPDGASGSIHEVGDGTSRDQISTMLKIALADNRVTMSDAVFGDMTGKYIEIAPEVDKDGKLKQNSFSGSKPIKLFVQDLMQTDEASIAFKNDPKTRALLEVNAMTMYNYGADVKTPYYDKAISMKPLEDGQFEYDTHDGHKDVITKEQAQRYMESKFMLDDIAGSVYDNMYNYDGTQRAGYDINTDLQKYIPSVIARINPDVFGRLQPALASVPDAVTNYGSINPKYLDSFDETYPTFKNDAAMYNQLSANYAHIILSNLGLVDDNTNYDYI